VDEATVEAANEATAEATSEATAKTANEATAEATNEAITKATDKATDEGRSPERCRHQQNENSLITDRRNGRLLPTMLNQF